MVLILNLIAQGAQMMLVLISRRAAGAIRARLRRACCGARDRQSCSLRDLLRLIRKEAVLAENASWLSAAAHT